jgi:hypothetical protein
MHPNPRADTSSPWLPSFRFGNIMFTLDARMQRTVEKLIALLSLMHGEHYHPALG